MSDIETAKSLLVGNATCVLVKGKQKYISTKNGIAPMMEYIGNNTNLVGFSVADRIVGKAAAMLFCLAQISCVYAEVISDPALNFLNEKNILVTYKTLTKNIINRTATGLCPMEQTVKDETDPRLAYEKLKQKINELKNASSH